MNRIQATNLLRTLLDEQGLKDWHVRLTSDLIKPFLGMCSYKDKSIILNAHHINTHPDEEIVNTIRHEVAHALTPGNNHNEVWAAMARKLGCDNTLPCATYGFSENAIDAIRSGAELKVEFTTETHVIRTPKYTVSHIQDLCETCGKVAKEKSRQEVPTSQGNKLIIQLECGHFRFKSVDSTSPFHLITFDGDKNCKHTFGMGKNRTTCSKCGAHRLYEFQVESARALERAGGKLGIFHEMGLGKEQSLDSIVYTLNGPKKMGDIQLEDKVISDNGKPYSVIGIYPQGIKPIYKISFSDGSSTECGEEHIWAVNTPMRKYRDQPFIIKKTKELKDDLILSGSINYKWFIPITKPVEFERYDPPIDPYQMGCLLGDGSFVNGVVNITTIDSEISNKFDWTRQSDITYFLDKSYLFRIRELGLENRRSDKKFLPDIYKYNSKEIRLEVLRGLMDTDGSIWNNGVIEYTTVGKQLASDVLFLVESLGGTARISVKEEPKYIYKGETLIGKPCYRIIISLNLNPFKLKRKAEKWVPRIKYNPTRAIISIKYIGDKKCQCIAVDSPSHLYLTDNFIVTHNTIIALAYLLYHLEASPFLWVTRSGIKYQHAKEIVRILGKNAFPQIINSSKQGLIPDMSAVASYDVFRNMELNKIKEHGFKCIVLDECQAIKNPDSSRTQAIRALVKAIPKVIPLSGTPWKNHGSEFFTVLNMLDPVRFYSFKHFKDHWVETYFEGSKSKEGGIRNPVKFKEYIKDLVIRKEREEVMPELPLINRTKLNVELPDYARSAYKVESDKLVKALEAALIDGTEDSFKTNQEIMQSLIVMKQIIGIAKVPSTVEFATEFLEDTNRKLAIFVHHVECGELIFSQLSTWCKEHKQPLPLRITSSQDGATRNQVATDFNENKSRILIASTLASGEGLNLQTCSDCIMHERQWNPANEEQAEGRFIRIGQMAQFVNAVYVHGDDTIDTILDGIVEKKRIAFHNSMNSKEFKGGWNEGDLIKELVNSIRSKR